MFGIDGRNSCQWRGDYRDQAWQAGGPRTAFVVPGWGTSSLNSVFGFMRGVGVVQGDIVGPIVPAEDWSLLTSAQGEDTSL